RTASSSRSVAVAAASPIRCATPATGANVANPRAVGHAGSSNTAPALRSASSTADHLGASSAAPISKSRRQQRGLARSPGSQDVLAEAGLDKLRRLDAEDDVGGQVRLVLQQRIHHVVAHD